LPWSGTSSEDGRQHLRFSVEFSTGLCLTCSA
jgi:hypothetical protein